MTQSQLPGLILGSAVPGGKKVELHCVLAYPRQPVLFYCYIRHVITLFNGKQKNVEEAYRKIPFIFRQQVVF